MRIAVVAPTYIPARRANTVQVMKMTQALAGLGHEVRLAVPGQEPPGGGWPPIARHYGLRQRFPIRWLPIRSYLRSYDYALDALRWAKKWQADLIYTRLPQAAAISSLTGKPTIFEVHDLPQGRGGHLLFRLFLAGRGARRLVTISHALAQDLQKRFRIPSDRGFSVVAPDGVDLERFADIPTPEQARTELAETGRLDLPAGQFTAGYTGHLYSGRGIRLILKIAGRLPDITFLIAGGEPDEVEQLRREVRSLNLQNVHLTGFIPNIDLPLYQAASDVLMMPYQKQVAASSGGNIAPYLSPMKLFEYLACGRPILSSNLSVLCEVLNAGNAVLLEPQDAGAWTAALNSLQVQPERRRQLSEQARRDAMRYTWENRAGRIIADLDVHENRV